MKIVIIVNNHNSFNIIDLCLYLADSGREIQIKAVCTTPFFLANQDRFTKRKISPYIIDGQINGNMETGGSVGGKSEGIYSSFKKSIIHCISGFTLLEITREFNISIRHKKFRKIAVNWLKQFQPDAVLSLSDRSHDYAESAILGAARSLGCKIILPYVAQFDIDAAVLYRMGNDGKPLPDLRPFHPFTLYKFWSYFKLRNQIYKGIFFQTPAVLNAAKRAETLSSYPWWVGNGLSDIVCVDSRHTSDKYIHHKTPKYKIAIVGHVQYDQIFQSYQKKNDIRQKLICKYKLDDKKSIIILSLPQYAEQGYLSWDEHWGKIYGIIKGIEGISQNLLLSVHPRSEIDRYQHLEDHFNCRILSEPLSETIGVANVFIASNSTTLVWAVLCGVPVISCWSPVEFMYEHLKSVLHIPNSENLTDAIAEILLSKYQDPLVDWKILSREEVFDGKFSQRFYAILSG